MAELGWRVRNTLRRNGIADAARLAVMEDDDLLALRNLGQKSLDEIRAYIPYAGPRLNICPHCGGCGYISAENAQVAA